MEALNSNSVSSGLGVHEELLRLHPQDDDHLADTLPDPFSITRINLHAPELILWRSLVDAFESRVMMSMVGGLKLFARWVPLALSPVYLKPS
jgi:hypothetical protein